MTRSPVDAPLTWNVAGLLADDPGASRSFDFSDVSIPLDDGPELARPISGHVRFRRTNRGIIADTQLQTGLRTECSRCLRPMEVRAAPWSAFEGGTLGMGRNRTKRTAARTRTIALPTCRCRCVLSGSSSFTLASVR